MKKKNIELLDKLYKIAPLWTGLIREHYDYWAEKAELYIDYDYKKVTVFLDDERTKDTHLHIDNRRTSIVGEAHGFQWYDDCEQCVGFHNRMVNDVREVKPSTKTIRNFLLHFEFYHIENAPPIHF